jgi:hypothetical protein
MPTELAWQAQDDDADEVIVQGSVQGLSSTPYQRPGSAGGSGAAGSSRSAANGAGSSTSQPKAAAC